ncbi:MAG TPA: DUF1697 domain-containing protein [Bauldia sp.]|nr:DUF1697 domain-containing protein [Bauldia sp.]
MSGFAALLRAVNVGGTGIVRMADLKSLCEGIGFRDVTTLLQSGNVVFRATGVDKTVARKLADAIEKSHGFRPAIMVRTADEIANVMKRNPFEEAAKLEPNRLLVSFFADPPGKDAATRLAAVKVNKEKLHLSGRELYVHYAEGGMGTSKVTNVVLERALGVPATARNWNTIGKLLTLARALE